MTNIVYSNKLMDEWNSNYIQLVDFVMTYNDEKKQLMR